MSAFEYPVLDGIAPSWADINVLIAGVSGGVSALDIRDIAALNSGWSVEVGRQKSGGRTIKRTTGDVTCEGSMTLYASGYQKLLRGLRAAAPRRGNQRRISLVSFNIQILWTPPGSVDILERRLKGCRLIGGQNDSSEGTDATQIECPLDIVEVVDVIDGEEIVAL